MLTVQHGTWSLNCVDTFSPCMCYLAGGQRSSAVDVPVKVKGGFWYAAAAQTYMRQGGFSKSARCCCCCRLLINQHDKRSHIIQTHTLPPPSPLPQPPLPGRREQRGMRQTHDSLTCRQNSLRCAHNHTNLHKSLIKCRSRVLVALVLSLSLSLSHSLTLFLSPSLPLFLSVNESVIDSDISWGLKGFVVTCGTNNKKVEKMIDNSKANRKGGNDKWTTSLIMFKGPKITLCFIAMPSIGVFPLFSSGTAAAIR